MMAPRRLCVSFSSGETSARMTWLILRHWRDRYDEIVVTFANTSEEDEEALVFARRCDEEFGFGTVWLEAVVHPEPGVATTRCVVSFETAKRDGEVFEDVIRKYGIPGPGFFHCTRELKERPIRSYLKSIGWETGTCDIAIGIRVDEIDRMSVNAARNRIVYPVVSEWPHRKIDVNEWFFRQPFRNPLKGYQQNCRWCWKKSLRKHVTLMRETPHIFAFPERMEQLYPYAGANPNNERKFFFRERMTVADIRELALDSSVQNATDDAREYQTDIFSALEMDFEGAPGHCGSSCEPFAWDPGP